MSMSGQTRHCKRRVFGRRHGQLKPFSHPSGLIMSFGLSRFMPTMYSRYHAKWSWGDLMALDLRDLNDGEVLKADVADVGKAREQNRQFRLFRIILWLSIPTVLTVTSALTGKSIHIPHPHIATDQLSVQLYAFLGLLGVAIITMVHQLAGSSKSPHVVYSADEIDISLNDVRGADILKEEVVKTLNIFLAYKTFREKMGGTPRRAILFEGPPGTGKTYMAKAMAKEAHVPFLFVSSSAFQTKYYGSTNAKIRKFFKELRKAARKEGGAIGFIEEIDAIGAARGGMGGSGQTEGVAGVVNELLIQMQSFDEPTKSHKLLSTFIGMFNAFVPHSWRIRKPKVGQANILIIGATNRAADLDPALLRPGRFDRSIYFDLPSRRGRRDIIDYYLNKKAHDDELDDDPRRDTFAAMTHGYSPVMIEHLMDEALIWAIRRGDDKFNWADLQKAKMTEEIGLAQPVEYTEAERRTIATHEAGHATVAHYMGIGRKLEVLSIIKRKDALGLLAHSDLEERFTKTQSEVQALIHIAMGGMVAEEIFFGEITTGPSSDLRAATVAAAQMVGSLGMAGSLISLDAIEGASGNIVAKTLADDKSRAKVESILSDAKDAVTLMLDERIHVVEALRDALLDRNELLGEEISDVIAAAETAFMEEPKATVRKRR